MILKDGTTWQPTAEQVAKWTEAYPAVSVDQELKAMDVWLDSNPTRRKTRRGMPRMVTMWLSRAQEKGGSPVAKDGLITNTRGMSSLDDLSHNFTGDARTRAFFIEKYGQSFENGVRIT